jgi:AbrB family looped-hinge helix DNA binding protein
LYHPINQNDSAVDPIVSAISKVTTKYQATIPQEVREFLGVRQGDAVQYLIERGEVKLKRVTTPDLAYLAAVEKTLTEWDSAADNDAFRDL